MYKSEKSPFITKFSLKCHLWWNMNQTMIRLATLLMVIALGAWSLTSCEHGKQLLSIITGNDDSLGLGERKKGLDYVKTSNPNEVQKWKNEPNVLVVTDYVQDNCAECEGVSTSLGMLAKKYGDKVAVLKINVSESQDLMRYAKSRGVRVFPSVEIHLNGEKLDLILGQLTHSALDNIMKDYLDEIPDNLVVRDEFSKDILRQVPVGTLPPGVERVRIPNGRPVLNDRLPTRVIKSPKDVLPREDR